MFSLPRYLARSQRVGPSSLLRQQMVGRGYSTPVQPVESVTNHIVAEPVTEPMLSEIGQSIGEVKWYEHLTSYMQLKSGDLPWFEYPIKCGQVILESVQYGTGASWWAVVILSSIFLRIIFFPLQLRSLRVSAVLTKLAPEIRAASMEAQSRIQQRKAAGLPTDDIGSSWGITKKIYAKHGVSPFSAMKYLIPQMPFLVLLFVSLRNMCFDPAFSEQLAFGGILWFADMTMPDPYFILPILSSLSVVLFFELQNKLNGTEPGLFQRWIPRLSSVFLMGIFSFLPAGLSFYILISSTLMFVFNAVFYNRKVRAYYNFPPLKAPMIKLSYEDIKAAQTVTPTPEKINPNSLRLKRK